MGRNIEKTVPKSTVCKEFRHKKNRSLIIMWLSILLIVVVFTSLSMFKVDYDLIATIILVLIMGDLIVIIKLKPEINYYNMQYGYHMLLDHGVGTIPATHNFDNKWHNKIKSLGFVIFNNNNNFDVYFRVFKQNKKGTLRSDRVLEMITIIKDVNIDFYADAIEQEYKKIWFNHQKMRLTKQVIIQFKKYLHFSPEIKDELDQIICFREGRNFLISINVGYFEKSKTIYYLHSDSYAPNKYYYHGVNLIKEVV